MLKATHEWTKTRIYLLEPLSTSREKVVTESCGERTGGKVEQVSVFYGQKTLDRDFSPSPQDGVLVNLGYEKIIKGPVVTVMEYLSSIEIWL